MSEAVRSFIRSQGIGAAVGNIILNPALAWVLNRQAAYVGDGEIVTDTAITCVLMTLIVTLFVVSGTRRELEAGRITITRFIKRRGKLWLRSFPWKPVTKKPTEVRMGKGKGDPEFWVDVIRPGRVIYELEGVTEDIAREAMRLAAHKLPIKTRFISREYRELR